MSLVFRISPRMVLSWWICIIPFTTVFSQSGLKFNVGSVYAFNHQDPSLGEDEIKSKGVGFISSLDFVLKRDNWKVEPGIGLGFKRLYAKGEVDEYDFTSNSSRLIALLYCHFLLSENWKIGVIGMAENNKDYVDFVPFGSDHFRYNAGFGLEYRIAQDLGAYLQYTRCISPKENIYLIQNPSDQIMLGLFIKFLTF